jgi:hypothetical protein
MSDILGQKKKQKALETARRRKNANENKEVAKFQQQQQQTGDSAINRNVFWFLNSGFHGGDY